MNNGIVENVSGKEVSETAGVEESESDSSSGDDLQRADMLKEKVKRKKKSKRAVEDEKSFFEEAPEFDDSLRFEDMNLSRPLLKAISAMSFHQPTPIQKACIPFGLMGRDICACAATGTGMLHLPLLSPYSLTCWLPLADALAFTTRSLPPPVLLKIDFIIVFLSFLISFLLCTGKTAAFMMPVIERLVYKPRQVPVTRVLVLVPTRELGVQVHSVTRQLAQFTSAQATLAVGGLDIKTQEAALRAGPDILIATPGRLIDHLHNCPSFDLSSIEILILDEADRMLDEYFEEQMKEIIRLCSIQRQTLLFSATMTDEVQDLAAVSLRNPVKVFVNSNTDVAPFLRQEFVRIRGNREGDREAILAALLTRSFPDHVMVFIQTKKQAHRLHILLGLLGLHVGELHGDLSQAQRLEGLRRFKDEQIDILVATDVAARGLDIEGVKTVINFTMPSTTKHYVHRVGRTARAGRSGRAVSLVGEQERKQLKEVVKLAKRAVKNRTIPPEVIMKFRDKIQQLDKEIDEVLRMEKEERELAASENQLNRVKNKVENAETKPLERTWFQSKKEKMQEKAAKALQEYDMSVMGKKKRKEFIKNLKQKKQQTPEERAQFDILKAHMFAERTAKRNRRQKRIQAMPETRAAPKEQLAKKQKVGTFDKELTNTSKNCVKQFRAVSFQDRKNVGGAGNKKGKQFKSKMRFKRK
uniref:RNA helicase n=1 Tax=Eptatretus burgeri TaxID=7764 RepID=A0A8C4NGK9_EPTBU